MTKDHIVYKAFKKKMDREEELRLQWSNKEITAEYRAEEEKKGNDEFYKVIKSSDLESVNFKTLLDLWLSDK